MLKKNSIPAFIILPILIGLAGGILRYLHITKGFNEDWLSTGSLWGTAIAVLTVIMAGAAVLISLSNRSYLSKSLPRIGTMGFGSLVFFLFASFLGMLSGFFTAWYAFKNFSPFDLFTGGMAVCAAMLCLLTARRVAIRGTGRDIPSAMTLIPPVAISFILIANYRELSVLPSLSRYIYVLLAVISILLLVFTCAAWIYRRISVSRFFASVFFALYMLPVVIFGDGIYLLRTYLKVGLFTSYGLAKAVAPLFFYIYGFFMAVGIALLFLRPVRKTFKESLDGE